MTNWDAIGINEFLGENQEMSVKKLTNTCLVIAGNYRCIAYHEKGGDADLNYNLQIEIPATFPKAVPIVREISYLIPRYKKYHINRDYNNKKDSLCLGSKIRILQIISKNPTVTGFVEKCVVPFLYSAKKGKFVFGELAHYYEGIVEDYEDIFDISGSQSVLKILNCLSKKKRIANKLSCPCGCGKRLGKCFLRFKINENRHLASRFSFKQEYEQIFQEILLEQKAMRILHK
jgi:hypothetical protein